MRGELFRFITGGGLPLLAPRKRNGPFDFRDGFRRDIERRSIFWRRSKNGSDRAGGVDVLGGDLLRGDLLLKGGGRRHIIIDVTPAGQIR